MDAEIVRGILSYTPATGVFTWRVSRGKARAGSVAGTRDEDGYAIIRFKGMGYKAHRLAWLWMTGAWPEHLIDHKNGVRDDNRWDNLREADHLLNNANCRSRRGLSGVKGVSWFSQYQKWKASFALCGKHYFIGHYDTVEEAEAAVVEVRAVLVEELLKLHALDPVVAPYLLQD